MSRALGSLLVVVVTLCGATVATAQSCSDKAKNGAETDVDCGGATCPKCLTARNCLTNNDCLSARCASGKCQQPPECFNKVRDRRETDVDCGGGECFTACTVGRRCAATWDCRSRICTNGACQPAATCSNAAQDGDETAFNCGGGCAPCASGQRCLAAADCRTGVCTNNLCVAPSTCSNGVLDAGEGDRDCGGPCALCGTSATCRNGPSDCLSGVCTNGRCANAPTCADKVRNARETDVDCGGGGCNAACAVGQRCVSRWDCTSRVCNNGVCAAVGTPPAPATPPPPPASPPPAPRPPAPAPAPVPVAPKPSCSDGIKNNGESAVDCGGPCPPCKGGMTCFDDGDCTSRNCVFDGAL